MFPYRAGNIKISKAFSRTQLSAHASREHEKGKFVAGNSRTKTRPLILLLLTLCLYSCTDSYDRKRDMVFSGRTFAANGEIAHIDLREGRLQIAHGDIEGFMGAMTMWFETEKPASRVLKKLKRGDKIRFELKEVTNGPSVIFKIYILH